MTIARKIHSNIGELESLSKNTVRRSADPEMLATEFKHLNKENNAAFEEIDGLFQTVATAIRRRVTP